MKTYDNTSTVRKKSCSAAFGIQVRGVTISYTYIRKNACSSFKKFFSGESSFSFRTVKPLVGMHRNHWQTSIDEIIKSDYRVFVYRNPYDRCVSLYKNKFVQRSGNVDIFDSYKNVTGRSPHLATFDEFIRLYIGKLHSTKLDAHAFPQFWHLFPVEYNAAISLADLMNDMIQIVGADVAKKYFSEPINATNNFRNVLIDGAPFLTPEEFRRMSHSGVLPSTASFREPELLEIVKDIYSMDYKMIKRIDLKNA